MAREKAVVVGAGGISGAWFPPLKDEEVEIVGVVDLNVDVAQSRVKEYGLTCKVSDNLSRTLKRTRPDFVVDLTVPEAHCRVTCTALRAGCHVIGEKPMASSLAEARRMVKTSEETGKLYMVSQSRRWEVNHDLTRRVLAGGSIGRLGTVVCNYYMGVHFSGFRIEMPSPLVLDMAIHHFDMARFFTGADCSAVYAREFNPPGSWFKGDASAMCVFEMTGGIVFAYCGSWCAEGCPTSWTGNWRFVGEKGTVLLENDQPPRGQALKAPVTGWNAEFQDVAVPSNTLTHERMHGALREMLTFLRTGQKPQSECHDNIKSLAMVFGAVESNRKGRRIEIKI